MYRWGRKQLRRHDYVNMDHLLVLIKNPVAGRVKTRLARTIGNEKALSIYLLLLAHTLAVCKAVEVEKTVVYSDFVPENDDWKNAGFDQAQQSGNDLGARMENAIRTAFENGALKVVLIGSDCLELSSDILDQAFKVLDSKTCVLGPAKDGGYYLIGMTQFLPQLFQNKNWSTETVLKEAEEDLRKGNLSYSLLQELSDIDEEKDIAELNL